MSRVLDGTGLKRLHRDWRRQTDGTVALVLDGVASPYNVGSILRTAAAERVEHLWFTAAATGPTATGVRKTALGTEKYLTWDVGGTGVECTAAAKAAGYRIVALELTDDASYKATADVGNITVIVPDDVRVVVRYRTDLGSVSLAGEQLAGGTDLQGEFVDPEQAAAGQHTLDLDLQVDLGQLEVRR